MSRPLAVPRSCRPARPALRRRTRRVLVLFALVAGLGLSGCDDDPAETDTSATSDAGADITTATDTQTAPLDTTADVPETEADIATPDAMDLAEDATGDTVDGTVDTVEPPPPVCSGSLAWTDGGTSSAAARDHHATFVLDGPDGASLHVIGGTDYTQIFADHHSAPILEDGTLGAWSVGEPLPVGRAGQGVAQIGDHVFLLAGRDGAGFRSQVYRAERAAETGAIVGWIEAGAMPDSRFHSAAAVWNDTLYLTGGLGSGNTATADVFYTQVGPDGALGEWQQAALPAPRSHHAAFVHGDFLYLLYGFSGNPIGNQTEPHGDLIRAPLGVDGAPGEWETVSDTGLDLSTMAATVVGECTVVVGGLLFSGGDYSYRSQTERLLMPGALGITEDGLTLGRSHMHHAPWHDGHFYVFGGSIGLQNVTDTVEIATWQE